MPVHAADSARIKDITGKEIVIGTHVDLSGAMAMWGTSVRDGLTMAIDEANDAGGINGRRVRLVVQDDRYDPRIAVNIVRDLVGKERVFAIVSPLGTPTALAASRHATENGALYLFPIANIDEVTRTREQYLFTTTPPERETIAFGLRNLLLQGEPARVAVIASDDALGLSVRRGTKTELTRSERILVADVGVSPEATDFTAPLSWLQKAGVDVLAIGLPGEQALAVVRTAQRLKWRPRFLCSSACYSAEFAALGGAMVEGLYAVGQMPVPYPDTRVGGAWARRYAEKFGTHPTQQALEAYRNARLFLTVLERTGRTPTQENFIRALENLGPWSEPQVGGAKLVFTSDDHLGTHNGFLAQVKQGRWVDPAEEREHMKILSAERARATKVRRN